MNLLASCLIYPTSRTSLKTNNILEPPRPSCSNYQSYLGATIGSLRNEDLFVAIEFLMQHGFSIEFQISEAGEEMRRVEMRIAL